MEESFEEIIEVYAEFNVYCDELSKMKSDIKPYLSEEMQSVLKKAKSNLKVCNKEILELESLKRNVQNMLDIYSEIKKLQISYNKKISNKTYRNNLANNYPNVIDDIEKYLTKLDEYEKELSTNLKSLDSILAQLKKLRKEITRVNNRRKERERRNGYFLIILILSAFQIIFTFKDYSALFKIIDCLLLILLISYVILILVKIYRNKGSTKKFQIITVILNLLTSISFIILSNLLNFDINLRCALICPLFFINLLEYEFIDSFLMTSIFTSEFLFRLIILVSIWGTIIGIFVYLFIKNLLLLKVSISFIYLLIIVASINSIFYKKDSFFNKSFRNTLLYKFLVILIYGISIFSFPYYIQWCGLIDDKFQVFITVYSCVIGGLLTLGGVAWTIKQTDKHRNEDKILENRPLFYPLALNQKQIKDPNLLEIAFVSNDEKETGCFIMGAIENSDNSNIIVDKLYISNKEYKPLNNSIISKSNKYRILIKTNSVLLDDDIKLIVKDILDNVYTYKLKIFEVIRNGKSLKNILSIEEEKDED